MLWCAQPVKHAPAAPVFNSTLHYKSIARETVPHLSTLAAAAATVAYGPQVALLGAPFYFYLQRCLLQNRVVRPKNHNNTRVKHLDGKNVVITGATSGIGCQTAIRLALLGANVTCISRYNARQEFEDVHIRPWIGNDLPTRRSFMTRFRFLHADLKDLDTVRRVAAEINNSEWAQPDYKGGKGGIHMLINCAGILNAKGDARRSEDGIEEHTLVNAFSPLLLTELLAPTVAVARDDAGFVGGRVINVSSGAHVAVNSTERCEQLMSFVSGGDAAVSTVPNNMELYAFSKLINIMHADSLAQRGLCAVSLSPGGVATNIYRSTMPAINAALYWPCVAMAMKTPREGSETVFGCALRDDLEAGGFYQDDQLAQSWRSQLACDAALRDKVIQWASRSVGLQGREDVADAAEWEAQRPHQKMFVRDGDAIVSANKRRAAVIPQF